MPRPTVAIATGDGPAALMRELRVAPSILSADFAQARRAGRRGAGGRRARDPRRRDGRPLRPADHVRARSSSAAIADRVHAAGGRDRRAPDDRAARAPGRRHRRARAPTASRSTSRRRRTCTTRCERSARPAAPRASRSAPATPAHVARRGRRRCARPGAVHERQPRLGRSGVHPGLAGQARADARGAAQSTSRSRSTAGCTTRPPGPCVEAGANCSSPARRCSAPTIRRPPTLRSSPPSGAR